MIFTKDEQDVQERLAYEQCKLAHMPIDELQKNSELARDDFDTIDLLKALLMPFPF